MQKISSSQNPAIKKILQLQEKSRTRNKENSFVVEGWREINLALNAGYIFVEVYYTPEIFPVEELQKAFPEYNEKVKLVEITSAVYKKIAYRGSTEGIIGIATQKDLHLENIVLQRSHPLILVAEAPEKPGNIGALLRTADAAAVDAVLIADPKGDLYNPNIIRSSIGCLFTNQIATGSSAEIIDFLKKHRVAIYSAALQASVPYCEVDYRKGSAIVVGTEATGLTEQWLSNTSQNILIPMQGKIDSMNVSVAAGILIFEAKRQRNFR